MKLLEFLTLTDPDEAEWDAQGEAATRCSDARERGRHLCARGETPTPGPALRRSILLVDDDPSIRETFTELLQEEGYEVSAVANGREALRHLRYARTPGLILLDLLMPEMNGWMLRLALNEDSELRDIPIAVVSAVTDLEPRPQWLVGVEHLTKPVDVPRLLSLIQRHCG